MRHANSVKRILKLNSGTYHVTWVVLMAMIDAAMTAGQGSRVSVYFFSARIHVEKACA